MFSIVVCHSAFHFDYCFKNVFLLISDSVHIIWLIHLPCRSVIRFNGCCFSSTPSNTICHMVCPAYLIRSRSYPHYRSLESFYIFFSQTLSTMDCIVNRCDCAHRIECSVKEPNISIYFFFPPVTQWCSISDVLFTDGREVLGFSVLKYY